MLELLEISGDQIAKLDDTDLRALVRRLCEAELRRCALPLSAVTAGGDQNAPDGGIDVRVQLSKASDSLDFIPRPISGFQVKRSDMPASSITAEMRPQGQLRASIDELAAASGAYVIVSSRASTSDSVLFERKKAMLAAVADSANAAALHLDFYDRERLATWVRAYPGEALWVRERIGEPLSGWRGYGNWALRNAAEDFTYLLDDSARLTSLHSGNHDAMPMQAGINAMREALTKPRNVSRLIGLAGVGKTRLAQALFDSRIGDAPLDSSIVVYADEGDTPEPTARQMLQRLVAKGQRAIVIVDNCNPGTHRALAQVASAPNSSVSLLTVEYDIADGEPEETQVFRLDPASPKILVEILQRLAPHLSPTDRQRVADFAGGNARIALALANTVRAHETLGVLNDSELFSRLFHQRQESDTNLKRAAEVCALVYSFDGETLDGNAELQVLSQLADISAKELFRHVSELLARGLAQRRSKWRAVLPPAIANRLAKEALVHIPSQLILDSFARPGRDRLLGSFTRRLGYLHDSQPAIKIASEWLTDPSALGTPARLGEESVRQFVNVAPLAPATALQALEAAAEDEAFLSPSARSRMTWASLVRSLAYESQLFDRAALLLARFVAAEQKKHTNYSAADTFTGLFQLVLSGTQAPVEQRIGVITGLVNSGSPALIDAALTALNAMLEAGHFSSMHDFSFGARPRDFGWRPRTDEEVRNWFRVAIGQARTLVKIPAHEQAIKDILGRRFRALWLHGHVRDELESIARELTENGGWAGGWQAVRMSIHFDADRMQPDALERLRKLESDLSPRGLSQMVDAYVLARTHDYLDVVSEGGDTMAAWHKANGIAEDLGKEAASSPAALSQLLHEILKTGPGRRSYFGRGLALAAVDPAKLWNEMRSILAGVSSDQVNVSVFQGFVSAAAERDPAAANLVLDKALADPVFAPHFPLLQTATRLDNSGLERLLKHMNTGAAPAWMYGGLAYGNVGSGLDAAQYRRIVLAVVDLPDGMPVALDMAWARLYRTTSDKSPVEPEIIKLGRELLLRLDFRNSDDRAQHPIEEIAKVCLAGDEARESAVSVCGKFADALTSPSMGAWHYGTLAAAIFKVQPRIALDAFLGPPAEGRLSLVDSLVLGGREISPVHGASDDMLIAWGDEAPVDRYPKLAREIELFHREGQGAGLGWTPIALRLLNQAQDRLTVLRVFQGRFHPRTWSGSLAEVFRSYLPLLDALESHEDLQVRTWAREMKQRISHQIERESQNERREDESFE